MRKGIYFRLDKNSCRRNGLKRAIEKTMEIRSEFIIRDYYLDDMNALLSDWEWGVYVG